MSEDRAVGVTQLLQAANAGDRAAADRFFSLMYDELKRLAHRRLRSSGRPWEFLVGAAHSER